MNFSWDLQFGQYLAYTKVDYNALKRCIAQVIGVAATDRVCQRPLGVGVVVRAVIYSADATLSQCY